MSGFCDLNLNITNLPEKAIDQLVEYSLKCKKSVFVHSKIIFLINFC
jgi:hypothetical protein